MSLWNGVKDLTPDWQFWVIDYAVCCFLVGRDVGFVCHFLTMIFFGWPHCTPVLVLSSYPSFSTAIFLEKGTKRTVSKMALIGQSDRKRDRRELQAQYDNQYIRILHFWSELEALRKLGISLAQFTATSVANLWYSPSEGQFWRTQAAGYAEVILQLFSTQKRLFISGYHSGDTYRSAARTEVRNKAAQVTSGSERKAQGHYSTTTER